RSERFTEQYDFRQYCTECTESDEHCIDCTDRQVFSGFDHHIKTGIYCDKCEKPFIPTVCMCQSHDPAYFEDACYGDFYPLHIHKNPPEQYKKPGMRILFSPGLLSLRDMAACHEPPLGPDLHRQRNPRGHSLFI